MNVSDARSYVMRRSCSSLSTLLSSSLQHPDSGGHGDDDDDDNDDDGGGGDGDGDDGGGGDGDGGDGDGGGGGDGGDDVFLCAALNYCGISNYYLQA